MAKTLLQIFEDNNLIPSVDIISKLIDKQTINKNNMKNKKQSSVEWLEECLSIHFTHEQKMQFNGLFEQAKAIHKEEIMDAFQHGKWDWHEHLQQGTLSKDPAEYYNETFGE